MNPHVDNTRAADSTASYFPEKSLDFTFSEMALSNLVSPNGFHASFGGSKRLMGLRGFNAHSKRDLVNSSSSVTGLNKESFVGGGLRPTMPKLSGFNVDAFVLGESFARPQSPPVRLELNSGRSSSPGESAKAFTPTPNIKRDTQNLRKLVQQESLSKFLHSSNHDTSVQILYLLFSCI